MKKMHGIKMKERFEVAFWMKENQNELEKISDEELAKRINTQFGVNISVNMAERMRLALGWRKIAPAGTAKATLKKWIKNLEARIEALEDQFTG